jgi:histidyl-tRNA synthetase
MNDAPIILDYLSEEATNDFEKVASLLRKYGN